MRFDIYFGVDLPQMIRGGNDFRQTLFSITNLPSASYQIVDPTTNQVRFYRLRHPIWTP